MTRKDNFGFFWDITPGHEKRTPPEPVWLRPDYLPGLAEARAFAPDWFTLETLGEAAAAGESLCFDVECMRNYWLVGFRARKSRKFIAFELSPWSSVFDVRLLEWIVRNFCLIGFNSRGYDLPMIALALAGVGTADLFRATQMMIVDGIRPKDVLDTFGVTQLVGVNHVDLIEVAPLSGSLKMYAGRLHARRMQDLPFDPDSDATAEQIVITRHYNSNDLDNTALMADELREQIELREKLGARYGLELRSQSDAQIAESIFSSQVRRLEGRRVRRPTIDPGTCYTYAPPAFLQFRTELLRWVLRQACEARLVVQPSGKIALPESLSTPININGRLYQMGLGGLHSKESKIAHTVDDEHELIDRDVESFYPRLIQNTGMFPPGIGEIFKPIYAAIVDQRINAKRSGDKSTADSLKITINGTFGKLGSAWSTLYAPNLLIQVTLTGQLVLLMLIERLELAGIPVVSANTDGIVIRCPRRLRATLDSIVAEWEHDTQFKTEETLYRAVYSRDVNNYIAVKLDGSVKSKGEFANPWDDPKLAIFRFHKNPVNTVCIAAVERFLVSGVPIEQTVMECQDVRKFVTVRYVKGGAVKNGEYLGKAVRWYYATDEAGEIVYAASGNKVAKSDGARPLMTLPDELPADLSRDWYIREARSMLADLGAV